jgi:hypothetical protein
MAADERVTELEEFLAERGRPWLRVAVDFYLGGPGWVPVSVSGLPRLPLWHRRRYGRAIVRLGLNPGERWVG